MSNSRGVLQTLSNFFFTRKRKHHELHEKESPSLKCLKTFNRQNAGKTAPFSKLPREILWLTFQTLDLKSLIQLTVVSKQMKLEVTGFLSSVQQIPYLAKHFPELNYHEKCCFMSKLFDIFHARYSFDRVGLTAKWFKLACKYRSRIPLSIAFNTVMTTYTMVHAERIFDDLYSCWFQEDIKRYIALRSRAKNCRRLEKSISDRFIDLFYNRRALRMERAMVLSMFLRKTVDSRKQFYLAHLFFGPRNFHTEGDSMIDFETLEDGDGEGLQSQNELDGFPEFFQMLNELRNRATKSKHRWSRGQIFLILEDVTTQPLWSMANFARLLLYCPYLAINTTVIRCRNGLYEDASFVLYHLLMICESHNSASQLLLPIMKELERVQALELRELVVGNATNASQTGSSKRNDDVIEIIQEAFDRVFRPLPKRMS